MTEKPKPDHHAGYTGLKDEDIDEMSRVEPDEINDLAWPPEHDLYIITSGPAPF